ncbi:hypothetical protein IAQ61_007030 [Plenodomus lingam]|uniref:Nuclear distribution protein RO10 n=1 Tax=Leptosphaeria maculans (strain JN3 / isolate v23.1.3 / race Av1-4-5-6-7-8) TaxID=985895 RepID=E5AD85_LEPMJ|nr:hypothetical protein LEMA_P012240.1 [Plenodomus lingam JN3]KAH9869817.1 hypothetical protein IAQ61_007030 [Plenodomus lingam]CBY02437.1 hypothetical protein LEMA_P012240.1 [Plenodomus lingam JN3]
MNSYEEAILFTFGELESRVDRLEYLLGGPHKDTSDKPRTIPDRIHRIERSLQALAGKTSLLDDTHELVSKHKDVLQPQDHDAKDGPPLDTSQKAVLVVEHATTFATTASQLKALDDQQIPTSDGFAKLAMLQPRIAEAEARQLEQALKISELRRRHGLVNQRYKQIMFVGVGRCWVDYHERLTKALRTVVREEYKRKPDEDEGAGEDVDEGDESEEL